MVSITVDHVSKAFGSTQALDTVSLTVEPGEIFFLLGPSGCGKTTLIRTLAGFTKPDSGRVLFDGVDITGTPPHVRQAAMMFQNYALWPHLNVAQNVSFGLEQLKLPKTEIRERVDRMLDTVHLSGYRDRSINALSGGQQQRVALARALAVRPRCLLLDEPLSNLDAKLRLDMRLEIRRICKDHGLTTIYVTHDQKEALSVADRLAVMEEGRVDQVGTPREIYRRPHSVSVARFIGECNFIGAMVQGLEGRRVSLLTNHGRVEGSLPDPDWTPEPGETVVAGVRPESLRLSGEPQGPNTFDGFVVAASYLGEIAQYEFHLTDGDQLRVAELNPNEVRACRERWLHAIAAPEDVIVLPPPSHHGSQP